MPLLERSGDIVYNYCGQPNSELHGIHTVRNNSRLLFNGTTSYINLYDNGSILSGIPNVTILSTLKWQGGVRAEEETIIGNWGISTTTRNLLIRWDSQTSNIEIFLVNAATVLNVGNSFAATDISDKRSHNFAMVYNGSNVIASLDGKPSPTVSTLTGLIRTSAQSAYVGIDKYHGGTERDFFDGFIGNLNIIKDNITQDQISLFNDLPYGLYQKTSKPFYSIPSRIQYTLSADAGSFQTTGTNVNLLKENVLSAGAGSFNVAGQDVTLTYTQGYALIAGSGAYVLTGNAIDLLYGYCLDTESGNFEISGQNVSFLKDSKLSVESGTYSLTGQLSFLIKGFLLGLESGIYSLTGQIVELDKSSKIIAGSSSFVITGNESDLLRGYSIIANSGAYGLTGNPIDLLHRYIVDADLGGYNILGDEANLLKGHRIYAASESFSITGKDINFNRGLRIGIDSGIHDIDGQNVTLTYNGIVYIDGCLKMVFISNQPNIIFADISNQPNIVFADTSNQPTIIFADLC